MSYIELYCYNQFKKYAQKARKGNNKKVLTNLLHVFAINVLVQDSGLLELGFFNKADR